MTPENAFHRIEQALPAIYGYAYSMLYDKSKAEDLASEITLEILKSIASLRNEKAFWKYVWRIAENTFRKFIRRESLIRQALPLDTNDRMCLIPDEEEGQEHHDTLIFRLRQELSLLGKRHRAICVSYYVQNKSCSDIAEELSLSVDTVKQTLFRTRKELKEGMNMNRKLGQRSYDPGTFQLAFWGDRNHYDQICNRKLPGTILLTAYRNPLTAADLSMELGVAMPYLEDELEILEAAGLLIRNGKKYETNIIVITSEYEKAFEQRIHSLYASAAQTLYTAAKELLPRIRELDFHGNVDDENRLLFGVIHIALMAGYYRARERSPNSQPQKLALDGSGWVYGYDNNYENLKFRGIVGRANNAANTAYFSAVNYRAILPVQDFEHRNFPAKVEGMCDAILEKSPDSSNETLPYLIENGFVALIDGKLSANFPVFTSDVFNSIKSMLTPMTEMVAQCMIEASDQAEPILAAAAPAHLTWHAKDLTKLLHRMDVSAYIMEELLNTGRLFLPAEKTPLCIYGVKR